MPLERISLALCLCALLCASVSEHQKENKQVYSEDPSARVRASHRLPAAVRLADLAAGEEGDLADVVRDLADVDPVDVPVGRGEGLPLDDQRHGLRGLLRANTNNYLTRLCYATYTPKMLWMFKYGLQAQLRPTTILHT